MDHGNVCLEVALNGAWTRRVQPGIPITPDEIVADAVACAQAGASVVHFHAYNGATGEQTIDLELIAGIIERIQAEVDVIVYPAIRYMSNAEAIVPDAGAKRYAHLSGLAERGLLEWLVVDPGSTNLVSQRDIENGAPGLVDINTLDAIRHALQVAGKFRLHPGMAIYEPGYLRLAAALCRRMPDTPPPMYRLMFSQQFTFGLRPSAHALRAYIELLDEEVPGAPWMIAGLGVDLQGLIPLAVAQGGHVRVGLEDMTLGSTTGNLDLVRTAVGQIKAGGGHVATAAEVRAGFFEKASSSA